MVGLPIGLGIDIVSGVGERAMIVGAALGLLYFGLLMEDPHSGSFKETEAYTVNKVTHNYRSQVTAFTADIWARITCWMAVSVRSSPKSLGQGSEFNSSITYANTFINFWTRGLLEGLKVRPTAFSPNVSSRFAW
jgi:hypothetical protein